MIRFKLILISTVTALTVLLTILLPLAASRAGAGTSPVSSKFRLEEGLERPGLNICRCPFTTAECTCEMIQ